MYFVGLHGHGTSSSSGPRGAPTECTAGTKSPSVPSRSSTGVPTRVMIRMLTTTYGESVTCTPSCEIGPPSGPIENGTTYMVRPRIDPANTPRQLGAHDVRLAPVVRRAGVVRVDPSR